MSRTLLTGGAGFIGSQLARDLVGAGHRVRVLDKLTYAGRRAHLEGVDCELVVGDVRDRALMFRLSQDCDTVVHAAAESHVAHALDRPIAFLETNVVGTAVALEAATAAGVERFVMISTDEVFGATAPGVAPTPQHHLCPGNAYAASKAGAEALVHAWRHTHGLPSVIVRCTNNYGPRQHPEKAIPCWTLAALKGGPIPVHGQGLAVRDWLHVRDFSAGVLALLRTWKPGRAWHFAGQQPKENRTVAQEIADRLGGGRLAFGPDRQGQDARYALDDTAARAELGWAPQIPFSEGIQQTIDWYRDNRALWD